MSKYFIIGVSGATNGGKSTLCHRLCQHFKKTSCICMDDYFWDPDSENHTVTGNLNYINWEVVTAVDFQKMLADVKIWIEEAKSNTTQETPLLFIEGIVILNFKPLEPYFSKKFFLTMPKDVCWNRRKLRVYVPPDPPCYFDAIAWPMYLKNKEELSEQTDLVYIDGSGDQEKIFEEAVEEIQQLLAQRS